MSYSYQQDHVVIRSIERSDTPNVLAWRNHPDVRKNLIQDAEITEAGHTHWLEQFVDTGKCHQFVIESDGTPVGCVFLKSIEPDQHKAEFGIFMSPTAHGKGIGTIAACLILQHGFEVLGLERIYLCVFANNPGAIRSYEKVGFQHEGMFRKDFWRNGESYDMVHMAILRDEWRKAAG